MKKIKYLMATLLVGALTLTGCGEKKEETESKAKSKLTAEEVATKVTDNYANVNNYDIDLSLGLNVKINEEQTNISMDLNGTVDQRNRMAKATIKMNSGEDSFSTDMYLSFDSTKKEVIVYMKNPENNEWIKNAQSLDDVNVNFDINNINNDQVKELMKKIFESDMTKQLDADDKNYNYEITITDVKIQEVLKQLLGQIMNVLNAYTTSAPNTYEQMIKLVQGNININLSLDKETYYVTKLKIDIKDLANKTINNFINLSESEAKIEISRADASLSLSNLNKAEEFVIPNDALNATDVSNLELENNLIEL